MLSFRPAKVTDLDDIEKLLNAVGQPLSTLPANREALSEKLDQAERSFSGDESLKGQERYLFVLEDLGKKAIIGTSGIDVKAGNGAPFYNYRRDSLFHSSQQLGVHNEVPVLYLSHELSGRPLLRSLCLHPDYRQSDALSLLSRGRFLFFKLHRERFGESVIVEIQGQQDEQGNAPFWDSLGRHFFGLDFRTADYYSGVKSKTFIAEMMPVHPIYEILLTEAAQRAIGCAHPLALYNQRFLESEGFRAGRHIDIFDGGPTLEARIDDIATVRNAREVQIKHTATAMGQPSLVCNTGYQDYRATTTLLAQGLGEVTRLASDVATLLGLEEGDSMLRVSL